MEEENHNQGWVFSKFCQISTINRHGAVGSASAWQTRGRGLKPVLMRYFLAEKITVLSVLFHDEQLEVSRQPISSVKSQSNTHKIYTYS